MVEDHQENVPDPGSAARPRMMPDRSSARRTVQLSSSRRMLQLADVQNEVRLDGGTFLQRSGVSLFLKVLLIASIVILGLFINLLIELGRAPGLPDDGLSRALADGDSLHAIRVAAQYRAMGEVSLVHRDAAWTHFMLGIKEVVVAVFFPLLTGILGYIFGTNQVAGASSAGETRG
jgi:hypothetical protein